MLILLTFSGGVLVVLHLELWLLLLFILQLLLVQLVELQGLAITVELTSSSSTQHLLDPVGEVLLGEGAAHHGEQLLVGADQHHGGESRVQSELGFDLRVISGLGPEGAEGFISELIEHLFDLEQLHLSF